MAERLEFPYIVKADYTNDRIARPFLPVRLRYRQKELEVWALLDSGADTNVLPYRLGLDLGANWEKSKDFDELQGLGGLVQTKQIVVDLSVGAWPNIRMIFAWASDNDIPILLGQLNFFHKVDVCFYRSHLNFALELSSDESYA